MAIFRGIGGAGDSTTDATLSAVTEQATNAVNSATAAASSASSASTSASNASTSATNASASAAAASTSEINASASESAAATSAAEAAVSAASIDTDNIVISGGTIDNTVIGAIQPSSGYFINSSLLQDLTFTGNSRGIHFNSVPDAELYLNHNNGYVTLNLLTNSPGFDIAAAGFPKFTFTKATGDLTATSFTGNLIGNVKVETALTDLLIESDGSFGSFIGFNYNAATSSVISNSLFTQSIEFSGSNGRINFKTSSNIGASPVLRQSIKAGGQIEFYEDTGTTPKVTWVATTETLNFADNVKAVFGDGSDLEIYSDGTNGYITGTVTIPTADVNGGTIDDTTIGGTTAAAGTFTTLTATGTTTLAGASTSADITFGDNAKAIFGAGSDLQIYHDGSQSYISEVGQGSLRIQAEDFQVRNADGTNVFMYADAPNGGVLLYHNGSSKFETTSTGIDVTGTVVADGLTVDTNTLYVDSVNNRVGIGTSSPGTNSPSTKLEVSSADSTGITVTSGTIDFGFINFSDGAATTSGQLLYNHFDNYMRMYVNGAERVRINSSGNVGIGTSSPSVVLNVKKDQSATTAIKVENANAGTGAVTNFQAAADVASLAIGVDSSTKTGTLFGLNRTSLASIMSFSDSALGVGTYGATPLVFGTSNTERMRIDSDGNVGIGTSSPTQAVSVGLLSGTKGLNIVYSPSSAELATFTANAGTGEIRIGATGSTYFPTFYSNGYEAMRITSAGNVGIGTTSPAQLLQVGSASGAIRVGAGAGLEITHDNSGNTTGEIKQLYAATSASAQLKITSGFTTFQTGTSGTERLRIDSSGNLLVGTTSFAAGANGGISMHPTTNGRTILYCGTTVTTSTALAAFVNPNGQVGTITTSGSATAYNTSSDYRLKEDWVAVADASTRVNALKPVNFAWKATGDRVDGFLAHELAEVVPEAVTGEKDAVDDEGNPVYQGIDQSKLVPLLTAALQEALTKIETLEARVAALESN